MHSDKLNCFEIDMQLVLQNTTVSLLRLMFGVRYFVYSISFAIATRMNHGCAQAQTRDQRVGWYNTNALSQVDI